MIHTVPIFLLIQVGSTALQLGALKGHASVVSLLLDAKANTDHLDIVS
jgi:ankyrin repeat protein